MQFQNDITYLNKKVSNNKNNIIDKLEMPKCSDIYNTTQTKIAYLNQELDLTNLVNLTHLKFGLEFNKDLDLSNLLNLII